MNDCEFLHGSHVKKKTVSNNGGTQWEIAISIGLHDELTLMKWGVPWTLVVGFTQLPKTILPTNHDARGHKFYIIPLGYGKLWPIFNLKLGDGDSSIG